MNISHIRYFIAAAEKGSYAAAAASCYVTVQTISKAVSHLERSCGNPLFSRTAAGVELTEFGRLFYDAACRADQSFSELEHAGATFAAHRVQENLSVALSSELYRGSMVEAEDLSPFMRSHPYIHLVLHGGSPLECVHAVETHAVDAALITGEVDSTTLAVRELVRMRRGALIHKNHPLAHRDRITISDLRDYPVATPPGLTDEYLRLMEACRKKGFIPQFADIVPTLEAHRAFVGNEQGIVLVTEGDWVSSTYPDCTIKSFFGAQATVPLCFVFDPERSTNSLEAFCRFAAETARREKRRTEQGMPLQ